MSEEAQNGSYYYSAFGGVKESDPICETSVLIYKIENASNYYALFLVEETGALSLPIFQVKNQEDEKPIDAVSNGLSDKIVSLDKENCCNRLSYRPLLVRTDQKRILFTTEIEQSELCLSNNNYKWISFESLDQLIDQKTDQQMQMTDVTLALVQLIVKQMKLTCQEFCTANGMVNSLAYMRYIKRFGFSGKRVVTLRLE